MSQLCHQTRWEPVPSCPLHCFVCPDWVTFPELVTVSGTARVTLLCSTARMLAACHWAGGWRVCWASTRLNTAVSSQQVLQETAQAAAERAEVSLRPSLRVAGTQSPSNRLPEASLDTAWTSLRVFYLSEPCATRLQEQPWSGERQLPA